MEDFVTRQLELSKTSGLDQGYLRMRTLWFTLFKLTEAILRVPDVSLRTVLRCAGDIEGAHVHRQRIIDQGGTPSSDAYSALIQCVKEMTDNSTNALALWQESQACGVVANIYLYNTIISNPSKARKLDLALDLFKQMKANCIQPSSVTFVAIIAACCRVGVAQSTEVLFDEAAAQHHVAHPTIQHDDPVLHPHHAEQGKGVILFQEFTRANVQLTAHMYKVSICRTLLISLA
jgi:pentatricopeptide repeat protein